jgi:hypothetical protein
MPTKTDTYFRHLKPAEKDYKRSDEGGLFMLVTTTGSQLWRFGYRYDGKQKLLAIGPYPIISLLDARAKRDDAKRLLAEGIDPSVERKAERREARIARANTFEAVAKELMEKFRGRGRRADHVEEKAVAARLRQQGIRQASDRGAEGTRDPRRLAEDRKARTARDRHPGAQHDRRGFPLCDRHRPRRTRSDRRSPRRADHA